ncbi:hypothetical protein GCM10009682_09650 [Luedemannella flava]|uniref:Low molecular weight protein antigen 6 PH domain-containing protein n=1 Tax=Luedemannella flava TaxID=349316 RepID=A0ABP4XTJ3_9ACTN
METAAKTLRYRHSSAITVAAVVALIGALPMLAGGTAFGLILLVPAAVALWSWRAGTDVGADGLRVRAVLTSRRVPWSDVAELAATPKGGVAVRLTSGMTLTLPAVPARALSAVAAAGGELTSDEEPARTEALS